MDMNATLENLNKRRFIARSFPTVGEATEAMLEIIGERSVGVGGSMTIMNSGILDALSARGNSVYCHTLVKKPEKEAQRRSALNADVYLCSANAVTESGRIVNIEGTGNRLASVAFGPKTVMMLVGKNKLVANVEEGIARIKRDCCPNNARRHGFSTPCALTGKCGNCTGVERMCNITSVQEYPTRNTERFYVFLVDEDLGW